MRWIIFIGILGRVEKTRLHKHLCTSTMRPNLHG